MNSNREPTLESLWCIGIPACRDAHNITSEWMIYNHSKLSNHFSYVICAFTYRMVELDIVLLYIWSHVWGIIYVVGPDVVTVQTPRRPFPYDG
jgi:hypothetical protein